MDQFNCFCGHSMQEELAFVFEMLQQFEDALVQYDELDALFTQYVLNFGAGGKLWSGLIKENNTLCGILVQVVSCSPQMQLTGLAHSAPQCVTGVACCFEGPLTWRRETWSSVERPTCLIWGAIFSHASALYWSSFRDRGRSPIGP